MKKAKNQNRILTDQEAKNVFKQKEFLSFFERASKILEKSIKDPNDNFLILEDVIEEENMDIDDDYQPKLTRKV